MFQLPGKGERKKLRPMPLQIVNGQEIAVPSFFFEFSDEYCRAGAELAGAELRRRTGHLASLPINRQGPPSRHQSD